MKIDQFDVTLKWYQWRLKTPKALQWTDDPNVYTWCDWKAESKARYPIRWFFQRDLGHYAWRLYKPFKDAWYWFRCHTYNRYHMVDIRSKENGYNYGYLDCDTIILYACFAQLKYFVENEMPRVCYYNEYENGEIYDRRKEKAEIEALYHWWTVERPADEDYRFLEHYEKEQEMLKRLIDIRASLWS